ncbi:MAG: hypothetical protein WCL07_01610 [bacterium]
MEKISGFNPDKLVQAGVSTALALALGISAYAAYQDGQERSRKLDAECDVDRSKCVATIDYVPVGIFSGNPSLVAVSSYATLTPTPKR